MNIKTRNWIFVMILAIVVIASSFMMIQSIEKATNDNVAYADATLRGSGTKVDPYQIGDAEELGAFRDIINGLSAVTEKHAILTKDIVFDTETKWTPIGTDTKPFKGTFDGNGYTIKGLTINADDGERGGLFGNITGGATEDAASIIKNVILEKNGEIGSISVFSDSGSIVGYAYNDYIKIINCHNYLPIYALSTTGGIVGQAGPNTTIEECSNHGDIIAVYTFEGAPRKLGGIVGYANGLAPLSGDITRNVTIKNCYNEGNITGEPYSDTYICQMFGGIAGNVQDYAVISNCFSLGSVTAVIRFEKIQSLFGYVGDLTGDKYTPATAVSISECYYLEGKGTDEKVPAETGSKDAAWFEDESNFDSTKGWDFDTIFEMGATNYPVIRTSRLIIGGHLVGPGSYESPTTTDDSTTPMFEYDIKTNTLILNRFNYDPIRATDKYEYSPYYGYNVEAAIDYVGEDDFTITIADLIDIYNMSYSSNTYDWYGIRSTGKLIIQKQGAFSDYLTLLRIGFESSVVGGAVYDGVGHSSYGIYCEKGIEFKGGSIDIRGGDSVNASRYTDESIGIYSKKDIIVAANTLDSKDLRIKFVARGATQAIKFDDDSDKLTSGCSGIASPYWTGIDEKTTNAVVINKNTAYDNTTLGKDVDSSFTPYRTIFLCGIPIALMPDSKEVFFGDPIPDYTYTAKYMNSSVSTTFKAFLDENFYANSNYNPQTSTVGDKYINMYNKTEGSFSHFVFGYQASGMDSAQDFYVENNRTGTLKVKPSLPQYTEPEAVEGLKYTGQAQALVTAGTVSSAGATMYYSTDDGENWTTTVSTGTNVGTYSVWFKINGGLNYSNVEKTLVSNSISIVANDKAALKAAIDAANEYKNSIADKYATRRTTLEGIINDKDTNVYQNDDVTEAQIAQAITDIENEVKDAKKGIFSDSVDAIGTVTYPTSKDDIDYALSVYDALDDDLKQDTAVVADKAELDKAQEDYFSSIINALKPLEDVKHIDEVFQKINDAFNYFGYELDDTQKGNVADDYDYLLKAYDKYIAEGVVDLIKDIGNVEDVKHTDEYKEKIQKARDAYDDLTDDQKAYVTNIKDLEDAEDKYAAEGVIDEINAIGEVELTDESKEKIQKARETYDALTDEQKDLVDDDTYKKLTDAEAEYYRLAAESVKDMIDAIGTVKYPTSKDAIKAARDAYDALTGDQKALVSEETYNKLVAAEKEYDKQEDDATRTIVEDEDSGVAVETDGETGIPRDIELRVEVRTEVSSKEGKIDIDSIQANLAKTQKIAKVFDVKLIQIVAGEEKEIQPSDIKPGMKIKIHMNIPQGVNTKDLKVLHIHDNGSIELIENVAIDGEDAIIEVDSLSQFALVEKTGHGFCIGWILLIFGILEMIWLALYILARFGLWSKLEFIARKIKTAGFISLLVSDALFILALVAICLHVCALTIIFFILLLLMNIAVRLLFLEDVGVIKLPKSKKAQEKEKAHEKAKADETAKANAKDELERKKLSEYKHMSKWGLEASKKIAKEEDENGILAVGIIQNRKGKVYMFDPNGYEVTPGDIVEITDLAGEKKAVAVVIGNHMAPKERIVDPFKPINCVLYTQDAAAEKEAEEQSRREEEARIAAEEAAKKEAEEKARIAAEEEARRQAEQKAADEAALKAAEDRAKAEQEEKARREAEALSLKESLAKAKATESSNKFSKAYICDYLSKKSNVEINTRGNLTSTGLPLADTHYVVAEDKKTCFIYVYETEGSVIILGKMSDEYANTLKPNHKQVHLSAFPKQKDTWYSLILDDSYTTDDVNKILDDLVNQTKQDLGLPLEEGITLKESIKLAKATTSSHKFTKAYVCDYLNTKENVEVNTRGNLTSTGLPLADTHYVVNGDKKECFVYVYETEGSIILLAKMKEDYAKELQKKHSQVHLSAFPKQKDTWYSLIIDDSYSKEEFEKIIDDLIKR
ncbi:MAG: hypothetical protein E7338_02190 [Clostridiales bacterium]|nr:hypothetical protein [Clostridiales bacterium]